MSLYRTERSVDEHGAVRMTIFSGERPLYEIGMGRNGGGTWIHPLDLLCKNADPDPCNRPLGYVYADVDVLLVEAWKKLIDERAAMRKAQHEAEMLRRRTSREKVYLGSSVDLSCAEVYDALTGCECRTASFAGRMQTQVKYRGTWYYLGRTDLMDDVSTIRPMSAGDDIRAHVEWMRDKATYGARLRGEHFSVVDSATDG